MTGIYSVLSLPDLSVTMHTKLIGTINYAHFVTGL